MTDARLNPDDRWEKWARHRDAQVKLAEQAAEFARMKAEVPIIKRKLHLFWVERTAELLELGMLPPESWVRLRKALAVRPDPDTSPNWSADHTDG